MAEKIDHEAPLHPNAICKATLTEGTLVGHTTDLLPKYKELVTTSRRLCKRHDGLRAAAKAKKMGHGRR